MSFPSIRYDITEEDRLELAEMLVSSVNEQLCNALGDRIETFLRPRNGVLSINECMVIDKSSADKLRLGEIVDKNYTLAGRNGRLLKGTYGNRDVDIFSYDIIENGIVKNVKQVLNAFGENINLDIYYDIGGIDSNGPVSMTATKTVVRLDHNLYMYLRGLILGLVTGEFASKQFVDYKDGSYREWLDSALDTYLGTMKLRDLLALSDRSPDGRLIYSLDTMKNINPDLTRNSGTGVTVGRFTSALESKVNPFLAIGLCGCELTETWNNIIYPFVYNTEELGVNYYTGELLRKNGESYVPYRKDKFSSVYELLFRAYSLPISEMLDLLEGKSEDPTFTSRLEKTNNSEAYKRLLKSLEVK